LRVSSSCFERSWSSFRPFTCSDLPFTEAAHSFTLYCPKRHCQLLQLLLALGCVGMRWHARWP
jgi:hypothetical protein